MKIINYYFVYEGTKVWYTTFGDALEGMYAHYRSLFLSSKAPENLIKEQVTEYRNIVV